MTSENEKSGRSLKQQFTVSLGREPLFSKVMRRRASQDWLSKTILSPTEQQLAFREALARAAECAEDQKAYPVALDPKAVIIRTFRGSDTDDRYKRQPPPKSAH
jgi:hypothetical protein